MIDSSLENIRVKDPRQFSFAVFGGHRISRHVFQEGLQQVDHDPDIAFAIDLGDAVLKGRKPHYNYFIKQIDNSLGIPLLTVIGDNELSGEGRDLYQKIFGPYYYSFEIGRSIFFVVDNAGEKGMDNRQTEWLENELRQSGDYDNRIIFMHRPIYDLDGINNGQTTQKEASLKLIDMFRKYHVTHIFASQAKGFYEGDLMGIPYILAGEAGKASHDKHGKHGVFHYIKVNVTGENIEVEFKKEFSSGFGRMKHFKYRPVFFLDHLIRVFWLEFAFTTFILLSCLIYIIRRRKADKRNESA